MRHYTAEEIIQIIRKRAHKFDAEAARKRILAQEYMDDKEYRNAAVWLKDAEEQENMASGCRMLADELEGVAEMG